MTICAAVLAAVVSTAARADSIKLNNGITYGPARIMNVANGFVTFRFPAAARRNIIKSLSEIAAITLDANADYNRGESLLREGKHAQALAAFRASEKAARSEWEKTLICYRMLAAAEGAGQIEEAVKRWLAIVDKAGATAQSLELCPKNLAPAGNAQNDRAIAMLERNAAQAGSDQYVARIRGLLAQLYERQGRKDKARAMAAKLAGTKPPSTGPAPGQEGPSSPPQTPARGSNADALKAAAAALQAGRHAEVVAILKPRLVALPTNELPGGLYLLGKAQLEMAKGQADAAKARPLLLASGLNLMRVVAFFPDADEAPRALLAAGEVNEHLNNIDAARAAYGRLLERYGRSPVGREARQRLDRLSESAK